ncbi:NADase-type glycan-binding domain-containing protein [Bernardetia sp.]|uniref:NADase-type glycan-binding domain-containing protein n=1 Tax=Bernardetia sp. TaxID=1937974 RepID=UPI0025C20220|nr:hypothetical protein [Bernardetia sp.]
MRTFIAFAFFIMLTSFNFLGDTPTLKMSVAESDTIEGKDKESCYSCGDCSIYCLLDDNYSISSSSYLSAQGKNKYTASEMDDYNLQTAWFEGKPDYGIGEWLKFDFNEERFSGSDTEIDGLYLFNGYRKSLQRWKENSRIKKLLVYVNDKKFVVLKLADTYKMQHIKFEGIKLKETKSIKFEILEVYKGEKYSDVGVSEIKFTGIHHH